ncbi:MAG: LacI family transcriptional regulator [Ruminococcus sp.]|jgi:LacI family transcriptional regulator/LacI family repressor for deo operon, udp, cdd, tsx, nupC, and nupG|nr:LacI family transcriptional regulator [Ruminococcus sp.]
MAVTMKEVAERAGVSVATVSRVLNGTTYVAPEAAERINNAIKELGYSPNFFGRSLRKSETRIILAIVPGAESSFYNDVLTGMQDAASSRGYELIVGTSGNDTAKEQRLLSMLENRIVDAAVLLGSCMSPAEVTSYAEKYSIALACERIPGAEVLTVTVDDEVAALEAVRLIISKGHRKIGLVTAAGTAVSAVDRRIGYEKALLEAEITYREEYVYMGTYSFDSGVDAYKYFSKLIDPPSAIFCISDLLAAAILKSYASDTRNGHYFKVMGFDNIQLAELITPGLTTVSQPSYDIGYTVIEKVISRQSDKTNDSHNKHIKLPFKIIERESL